MQEVADEFAGVHQLVQVNAGVYAHAVQHVDHIFGGDVAGGDSGFPRDIAGAAAIRRLRGW